MIPLFEGYNRMEYILMKNIISIESMLYLYHILYVLSAILMIYLGIAAGEEDEGEGEGEETATVTEREVEEKKVVEEEKPKKKKKKRKK